MGFEKEGKSTTFNPCALEKERKKKKIPYWYLLAYAGIEETCICILVINTQIATKGASIKYSHNFFLYYLT